MKRQNDNWDIRTVDSDKLIALSAAANIPEYMAGLLVNRGIDTLDKIKHFFNASVQECYNPFLMSGMERGVKRLRSAIHDGEKILIFGDFDVDGLTGTSLLHRAFSEISHGCIFSHVPDRMTDGYGLNKQVFDFIEKKSISVIVTVDCGISNVDEAALAKKLGIDLIITDHHIPPGELPDAYSVINPKQPGCAYPFKDLSGVGLAMKLLHGFFADESVRYSTDNLYMPLPDVLWEHLDLVALGTIADIVPLLDENRIFVKHGLSVITKSQKPGIQALRKVSGLDSKKTTSFDVGFKLAPRINAAGRVGDARKALSLLITNSDSEAASLAEELDVENQNRKDIERKILDEARTMYEPCASVDKNIIVLSSKNWHPGVIGIVASRLCEQFFLPTILIGVKDGVGRGSARSIPGFHIYETMCLCKKLLQSFGGHERAAGLSIKDENIPVFKLDMEKAAAEHMTGKARERTIAIDDTISIDSLSIAELERIEAMAPFGEGNKEPVFCARNVRVQQPPMIVGMNHLKMKLRGRSRVLDAIGFNMGDYKDILTGGDVFVDIVFTPQINEWRSRRNIQLKIKDIKTG